MAQVEIKITSDDGQETLISQDLGSADLSSFDLIESFTLEIRRSIFPELQSDLLKKAQCEYKKKRKDE